MNPFGHKQYAKTEKNRYQMIYPFRYVCMNPFGDKKKTKTEKNTDITCIYPLRYVCMYPLATNKKQQLRQREAQTSNDIPASIYICMYVCMYPFGNKRQTKTEKITDIKMNIIYPLRHRLLPVLGETFGI